MKNQALKMGIGPEKVPIFNHDGAEKSIRPVRRL